MGISGGSNMDSRFLPILFFLTFVGSVNAVAFNVNNFGAAGSGSWGGRGGGTDIGWDQFNNTFSNAIYVNSVQLQYRTDIGSAIYHVGQAVLFWGNGTINEIVYFVDDGTTGYANFSGNFQVPAYSNFYIGVRSNVSTTANGYQGKGPGYGTPTLNGTKFLSAGVNNQWDGLGSMIDQGTDYYGAFALVVTSNETSVSGPVVTVNSPKNVWLWTQSGVNFNFSVTSYTPLVNATVYSWFGNGTLKGGFSNSSIVVNNTPFVEPVPHNSSGAYFWGVVVCNTGACTVSDNSSYNVSVVPGYLNISIFDETTTLGVLGNVTISNSTNSSSFVNIQNLINSTASLPTGTITITISNTTYYPRTYYLTINESNITSLNAYLLEQSAFSLLVRFHLLSQSQAAVSGATVTVQKLIGGAWVEVAQMNSDATGTAAFFLDVRTTYQVTVTAAGYSTGSFSLTPSLQDYYVTLSSVSGVSLPMLFTNLSVEFEPVIFNATPDVQAVSLAVIDANNSVVNQTLGLWFTNGTLIYSQTVTGSPAGANITVNVNLTDKGAAIIAGFEVNRGGFAPFTINRTLQIPVNYGAGSMSWDAGIVALKSSDASLMLRGLMVLMFSILGTVWVSRYAPPGYSGLVAALFLAFFSVILGIMYVAVLVAVIVGLLWLIFEKLQGRKS